MKYLPECDKHAQIIDDLRQQLREWESGHWESERSQNIRHDRDELRQQLDTAELELKVALSIGRKAEARVAELEGALGIVADLLDSDDPEDHRRAHRCALNALSPPEDKP